MEETIGTGLDKLDVNSQIEKLVIEKHLTYIEAVIQFTVDKDIEEKDVVKYLSRAIREKVQFEAEQLNMIKTTTCTLPFT